MPFTNLLFYRHRPNQINTQKKSIKTAMMIVIKSKINSNLRKTYARKVKYLKNPSKQNAKSSKAKNRPKGIGKK